ncbi:hypothetical protein HanRHA438_Chr13g0594911 [Helianthus annuus]|nr:hypothetical protein HanRHA438_Chr13g0594911 [Helianthus annuus]
MTGTFLLGFNLDLFGYYYLDDLVSTLTEYVGCVRCGTAHGLNSGSSFRVSLLSLRLYIAN